MLRFLYLVALAVWVGSVVFFSFGVAPSVFGALPRPQAGDAIAVIFPVYYAFGGIAGALVCLLGWLIWRRPRERGWRLGHTVLASIMLIATLYAALWIEPQVVKRRLELRQPAPPADAQADFDSLHRLAVQLNALVLLGGLALLAGTARRLDRTPP